MPTLSKAYLGSTALSKVYLGATQLSVSAAGTPGIAYFDGEGQSNMLGSNNVNQLDDAERKLYSNVEAYTISSGSGTASAVAEREPYILAETGETFGGVSGPQGEYSFSSSRVCCICVSYVWSYQRV